MREIFTIGHAARPLPELIELLPRNGVSLLVDIRRHPGSRHAPQFSRDTLRQALANARIGYLHLEALGGRRHALPDSLNAVWKNASFRGYADYMETAAFQNGLRELIELARSQRVAIMCAETVWWRCHRALVADALTAQGWQVWHIMDDGPPSPHRLTAPARIMDGVLTYRPE